MNLMKMSQNSKRVGIIGTGNIGASVSRGLLKHGFQVCANDLGDTNGRTLREEGVEFMQSAQKVAEWVGSEGTFITALPKPKDV